MLDDVRKMLLDSVGKMMKDYCGKEVIHDAEQGKWPASLWDALKHAGMITVGVAEEAGGTGGSRGDAFHMLRMAGKYSAPLPLAETVMANWLLQDAGLPVTEDPATVVVLEERDRAHFTQAKEGWTICGSAGDVPWARFAKEAVVIGRTENGYMLSKAELASCRVEPGQNLAGEQRDRVVLERVRATHAAEIESSVADNVKFTGALAYSMLMAGALERILELTLAYSAERVQFGQKLNRFQAIQQHLAVMSGEVAAAGIAAAYGAEAYEANPRSLDIMSAKIRIGEAAGIAVPIAHQVHGAIGFTDEHALHQSTRRLWSWREEFGTESEWSRELGKLAIQAGGEHLWAAIVSGEFKRSRSS